MGFVDTFIRAISYGVGGAKITEIRDFSHIVKREQGKNWDTIRTLWGTVQHVYLGLTALVILAYVFGGTFFFIRPISLVQNPNEAWIAWGIVITAGTIQFFGNVFVIYLQGLNYVALVTRWNVILTTLQVLSSFLALIFRGTILSLVVVYYSWNIVIVVRDYFLCRHVENGKFKEFSFREKFNKEVFTSLYGAAWRSAVGVIMSNVIIQASGLIYAQYGNVGEVASYVLALRMIQIVVSFSLGPFYSKIPTLARLRAEGNIDRQITTAKRGMVISYWAFVSSFIAMGVLGQPLFTLIRSKAAFPDALLWGLFGVGFFIERFGAMHIQIYSTTNRIIWHVANGITGTIYLIISFGLIRLIGVYAFPLAIIIGYSSFYSWYAAKHSYQSLHSSFWNFEKQISIPAFATLLIFCVTNCFILR